MEHDGVIWRDRPWDRQFLLSLDRLLLPNQYQGNNESDCVCRCHRNPGKTYCCKSERDKLILNFNRLRYGRVPVEMAW